MRMGILSSLRRWRVPARRGNDKAASSSPDEVLNFRSPQGLDAGERSSIGAQGTAGKGLSQSNLMADSPPSIDLDGGDLALASIHRG